VDVAGARAGAGVLAALAGADLTWCDPSYGPAYRDRPVLAIDVARYEGEPVAAVAAVDEAAAEAALELIDVDYEPLAAGMALEEALAPGGPLVHAGPPPAGHLPRLPPPPPRPGPAAAARHERLPPVPIRARRRGGRADRRRHRRGGRLPVSARTARGPRAPRRGRRLGRDRCLDALGLDPESVLGARRAGEDVRRAARADPGRRPAPGRRLRQQDLCEARAAGGDPGARVRPAGAPGGLDSRSVPDGAPLRLARCRARRVPARRHPGGRRVRRGLRRGRVRGHRTARRAEGHVHRDRSVS